MKLISSEASRLIVQFSSDEVRPEGGIVPGDFIKGLVDRYRFLVPPDLNQLNKDGFRSFTFRGGGLISGRRTIAIQEMTIVEGAVVIDTHNSDDGDFIFDDAYIWAKNTFGLRDPKDEPKRSYLSTVVVDLDEGVASHFEAFNEIGRILAEDFAYAYGIELPYTVSRIAFNCDPTLIPPNTVRTEFLLERRVNTPFAEGRFFCHSPFKTGVTVRLLEKVEQALLASRRG